jgi:hypothetical protein
MGFLYLVTFFYMSETQIHVVITLFLFKMFKKISVSEGKMKKNKKH